MLYQPMCARHNVELTPLAQPTLDFNIKSYFACEDNEPTYDCIGYWHFQLVTIDPKLPEIVRNAIAELRGATNRLNNGLIYSRQE